MYYKQCGVRLSEFSNMKDKFKSYNVKGNNKKYYQV